MKPKNSFTPALIAQIKLETARRMKRDPVFQEKILKELAEREKKEKEDTP